MYIINWIPCSIVEDYPWKLNIRVAWVKVWSLAWMRIMPYFPSVPHLSKSFPFSWWKVDKNVLKEENLQFDYGDVLMLILQLIVILNSKKRICPTSYKRRSIFPAPPVVVNSKFSLWKRTCPTFLLFPLVYVTVKKAYPSFLLNHICLWVGKFLSADIKFIVIELRRNLSQVVSFI